MQAEDESAQLCKRRIEHLKEHSGDQPAAAGLWKRKRMDRMMVEHLLRCGYYNTAVRLARQSGIEVGAARSLRACGRRRRLREGTWSAARSLVPQGSRLGGTLRPGGAEGAPARLEVAPGAAPPSQPLQIPLSLPLPSAGQWSLVP